MIRLPIRHLLCAALAAQLTGCTVGPDYVRPVETAAPAYKEAGDWKTATPSDQFTRGAWWKIYNDAELDRLETAAEEAQRERRTLSAVDVDPEPLPRTLRRIYHDLVLIGRVSARPLDAEDAARLSPFLERVGKTAGALLGAAGTALARRDGPAPAEATSQAIADCLAAIRQTANGQSEEAVRLTALAFALEQVERNLSDLNARADEVGRMKA